METIYRAYGSKAELFKAVVRAAVAGRAARTQVPVEQRPAIAAVIAEPDPHRQLQLYAATQPGIHSRAGPLMRVPVEAAASDAELARLRAQIEEERRNGQGRLAQLLADRGVLRPELSVEEAGDLLWTLSSLPSMTCSSCSGAGRPSATATGSPPPWPESYCPTMCQTTTARIPRPGQQEPPPAIRRRLVMTWSLRARRVFTRRP